jgi:hypothetical protein
MLLAESLTGDLGSLQSGGILSWTNDSYALNRQTIGQSEYKRSFWADDDEVHVFLAGKSGQGIHFVSFD